MERKKQSIDITQYVANKLNKNHWTNKNQLENLKLIKTYIRQYSIEKLGKWENDTTLYNKYSLENILEELDKHIIGEEDKKEFFNLYNHCITQMIGELKKPKIQITWISAELDCDIVFVPNNKTIKAIITNEKLPNYKVPSIILEEYEKVLK